MEVRTRRKSFESMTEAEKADLRSTLKKVGAQGLAVNPRRWKTKRTRRKSKEQWQREAHDLENPNKKAQRRALRYDTRVAAALDAWWDVTDADGSGAIDREEYLELSKSLYRVMIGDGDEEAAQRSAEDDWEEDCKGQDTMGAEEFRDAIFQCVEPP